MSLDLDNLKAAALAATPGPWSQKINHRREGDARVLDSKGNMFAELDGYGDDYRTERANAAYIAAANPAAVLELIAEIERLSAIVEKHIDPKQVMLTGLNVHNGSFEMDLEGGPVRLFAAAFADYFKESPASNYIEMHLGSTDTEIGELVCTLQRKQGKTPGAMKSEAEAQRDAALTLLREVASHPLVAGSSLSDRVHEFLGGDHA